MRPEIWAMAQRRPSKGFWFPSRRGGHVATGTVTAVVSRFFTELEIDGSIHRVRHNFGTDLLRGGANIRVVQKLMRHSSLETTALYTAVDEDELMSAINRLPAA